MSKKRRAIMAGQVATLSSATGKTLSLSRWTGYGGPDRYQVVENPYHEQPTGERDYSQSLTIGDMETVLSFAVKCAVDAAVNRGAA